MTKLQVPVPTEGTFPFIVAVSVDAGEYGPQYVVSFPAFASSGNGELVIVMVSVDGVQIPLLIVHLNTYVPIANEVIVDVGELAFVMAG